MSISCRISALYYKFGIFTSGICMAMCIAMYMGHHLDENDKSEMKQKYKANDQSISKSNSEYTSCLSALKKLLSSKMWQFKH